MQGVLNRLIVIFLCLAAFVCRDALGQIALPSLGGTSLSAHHTQAKLILSADTAKPGDTIWAGVDMKMDPGWHTYWKNPGAAGLATKIEWQLPPGVTAGEIQWPLPEKLPPIEVTTYGYEKEVVLLVPLTLATKFACRPAGFEGKRLVARMQGRLHSGQSRCRSEIERWQRNENFRRRRDD